MRKFIRIERGGFMLEAVISTPIILFMFLAIIMTFNAFINSMTAMGVLGNQAMYLSSLGTWTQAQQLSCERQLPGDIDWSKRVQISNGDREFSVDPGHNCMAYRLPGLADSAIKGASADQIKALTRTPDGRVNTANVMVPVCQPGPVSDPTGRDSNTWTESNVRDCFNNAGKGEFEQWFGYKESSATGTGGPAPLLLEVTYTQEWIPLCILPGTDEDCRTTSRVTRSLIVFSQSRRES